MILSNIYVTFNYGRTQIVGWPPIRAYRKNNLQQKKTEASETPGMFVKVSMDGAPYLRKIDLRGYKGYPDLLKALEDMFKFTVGMYQSIFLVLIITFSLFLLY